MGTRITVSVKGLVGLDDGERLAAELAAETGVPWEWRGVEDERVLGGVVEILIEAVIGKTVEMTLEAAVHAARRVVDRYRHESLDPPEVTVTTEPGAGPAPDAPPALPPRPPIPPRPTTPPRPATPPEAGTTRSAEGR